MCTLYITGDARAHFTSQEMHVHTLYHRRRTCTLYITGDARAHFISQEMHVHTVHGDACAYFT